MTECRVRLGEAAELAGVPVKTLGVWIDRGIITPAEAGRGAGSQRRFAEAELLQIATVAFLRRLGVSMEGIAPFTQCIHELAVSGALGRLRGRPILVRRWSGEVAVADERDEHPRFPAENCPLLVVPLWWLLADIHLSLLSRQIGREAALAAIVTRQVKEDVATETEADKRAALLAAMAELYGGGDEHERNHREEAVDGARGSGPPERLGEADPPAVEGSPVTRSEDRCPLAVGS